GLGDLRAFLVARRERGRVPVEELLGELVAYGNGPQQCAHAGTPVGRVAFPHRSFAFFHVHLIERERGERHIPVTTVAQTGDDRFMGVARERAAVVETHGERAGHGASFSRQTLRRTRTAWPLIPVTARNDASQHRAPDQMPRRRRHRTRGEAARRPGLRRPRRPRRTSRRRRAAWPRRTRRTPDPNGT